MTLPVLIVGVGADGRASLPDAVLRRIEQADALWGSQRLLAHFADHPAPQTLLQTPLAEQIELLHARGNQRVVVLASGDPGFFGIAGASDHEIVEEVSRKTDLEGLLDNEYTKLSGGERKRVILARAMAQQTPVMLFDEPEAHLDIRHQQLFFKLISGLARGENKLCVYSVHNPSLALKYSTVVMLMDAGGENIIIGPTAEVMTCNNLETAYGIKFAITRDGASGPLLYVDT